MDLLLRNCVGVRDHVLQEDGGSGEAAAAGSIIHLHEGQVQFTVVVVPSAKQRASGAPSLWNHVTPSSSLVPNSLGS